MKELKLDISKKLIAVTGNENGQNICETQILNAFEIDELPILIRFPDNITTIGSSYIEGIDEILLKKLSLEQLRNSVYIVAKDKTACRGEAQ